MLADFPASFPPFSFLSAVMLCGVPDNARGVMGCTLRFRPREFPHLYTILFTPSTTKIALKAIFICIYAKIIVSLHPQFHAGDVCASSAGVADIFKRRLLTLCSDALKLRNFHICIQDLATVDVLRDIDYPSCAYWCWYIFCVYVYAHTRTLTM